MGIIMREDYIPQPSETVATLGFIPDGVAGIKATLKLMAKFVKSAQVDPTIRAQAETIISAVPSKNARGEVNAVFEWVRDCVRYTSDVLNVETLITPQRLLTTLQGDCDDKSMLLAALLRSIGYDARFLAVGFDGSGQFDHVLAEVMLGATWVPLETTENVPMGWFPDGVTAEMPWHI